MKIVITESQYRKVVFNFLETLYGPKLLVKKDDDLFEILSDDGLEIFRVYTNGGKSKGCKRDMLVIYKTIEEIEMYMPSAVLRKKLFSRTVLSYVNEKTNLNIDCIDFAYNRYGEDSNNLETRYRFNVKKNKKTTTK